MHDIAIIGAGAAGLGAVTAAREAGLSCVVLEASNRVGGRAWTDRDSLGVPFDLGCHWLQGGPDNPFRAAAARLAAEVGPDVSAIAFHDGSDFLDESEVDAADAAFLGFQETILAAHRDVRARPVERDRKLTDAIDADSIWAPWFLRVLHHECAADPAEVSLADPSALLFGRDDRPVLSGYGDLVRAVAGTCPVSVGCPVTRIDPTGPRLRLATPHGTVEARTAIVTCSTGVLAEERIAIAGGGWPAEIMDAVQATPLGSSTKVGLRFRARALRDRLVGPLAPRGADIMVHSGAPEAVFWHLGTGTDGDLAICYLGGPSSRQLAMAGDAAQIDWAKNHLAGILGEPLDGLIAGAVATPFDRDPWIGGGYSYCRFGPGNRRADLAAPIYDRVFLAGEATSTDEPATVHGAWESGRAAVVKARRVLI